MSNSPNTSATTLPDIWSEWWATAVLGVTAVALGAAFLYDARRPLKAEFNNVKSGDEAGMTTFKKFITEGVLDSELRFERGGMRERDMLYFHKTFNDARTLGINSTFLASSGRYFGRDAVPVRIEVMPDGSARLIDGRKCYTAAKMACAGAILADVKLYDMDGAVVAENRLAVKLL